jgi:hypothetical protein
VVAVTPAGFPAETLGWLYANIAGVNDGFDTRVMIARGTRRHDLSFEIIMIFILVCLSVLGRAVRNRILNFFNPNDPVNVPTPKNFQPQMTRI